MVFGAISGIVGALGTLASIGLDSATLAKMGNPESVDDMIQSSNENKDGSKIQQQYIDATTGKTTSMTGPLIPGITSASSSGSSISSVCCVLILFILLT